jgi:hypothetical protein
MPKEEEDQAQKARLQSRAYYYRVRGLNVPGPPRAYTYWKRAKGPKDWKLRKRYGISSDQFMGMLEAQDGKCSICSKRLRMDKATHVDHDKATGSIRSLLCSACNMGLGLFGHRQELLLSAAEYLSRFQTNTKTES